MPILEIAAGAFLGWLAIQLFQAMCQKLGYTVAGALLQAVWIAVCVAFLAFCAFILIETFANLSTIGRAIYENKGLIEICLVILLFCGIGLAAYSDRSALKKARKLAQDTKCRECGALFLLFSRYDNQGKTSHDRPMGKCSQCGNEQLLHDIS